MKKTVKKIISALCILFLVAGTAVNGESGKGFVDNVSAAESKSEIYSCIEDALFNESEIIDVSKFNVSVEEASHIYNNVIQNNVELMNVDTYFSYEFKIKEDGEKICSKLRPTYISVENLTEKRNKVKSVVKYIISKLDDSMTDVEKALFVHDYLVLNTQYSFADEGIFDKSYYTAYGALVEHKAVCQGYSIAYAYILNKIGIETVFATSADMDHMWNMIKIDGKYYHVDVTYDDPTLLNSYPSDRIGRVSHSHFLVGDSTMKNELDHYNWEGPKANEDYSGIGIWSDVDSPMQYLKGKWYYASYKKEENYSTKIYEYDFINNRRKEVKSFEYMLWPGEEPGLYFDGSYTSVSTVNNQIYYNTPTEIRILHPDTGRSDTILRVKSQNENIYGLALQDGKLLYGVGNNPNVPAKIMDSGIVEKTDINQGETDSVSTGEQTTTPDITTGKENNITREPQTTKKIEKPQGKNKIIVKNTRIKKIKKYRVKKKIKITVLKVLGVKGYQVQYSTNRKFKKSKIRTFKGTNYTLKKLKKKKYYIRVRSFVVFNKKKVYGKWSKYKKVKI